MWKSGKISNYPPNFLYFLWWVGGDSGGSGVNRVMHYVFNQTECALKNADCVCANLLVRERRLQECVCVCV